ncbi:MAG: thiamine pyrophosphokinae [Capsulimonas sp.]|jgi:uncharacterized membrane-anchored protein|nr:thiamine pyrophosphokinae [Capsulimonas sp.]
MRELGILATVRPQSSPSRERTVLGAARVDKRTKNLTSRLRPGDAAVIDHSDLDALAARSLADARVSAVINARPFISGKYPNRGPGVLANASIPMYELSDPEAFARIREGGALTIDADCVLYQDGAAIGPVTVWDDAAIVLATQSARANLGAELEKFARNTLQYLDADKELLLDPTNVPALRQTKMAGRHVLVVVRGEHYKEDLSLLRTYLSEVRPAVVAVDGAADALLAIGCTPDIILGDMDSVSDDALGCGAQLIVHAYARRGGEAPGMARIHELGLEADTFPVPGTSEDAAMLLAYEHNADLIVAVGTHSNLEDFLDKGRAGMASTFLVRLKIGTRLVDARGVFKLYRPKPPFSAFVAVILSAMFPFVVLLAKSPIWRNITEMFHIWWQLHFGWRFHGR